MRRHMTVSHIRIEAVAQEALPVAGGGRVFAGAEHGADAGVLLVEAEPGEAQEAHLHPVEEVVIVQQGEVTFFLGARQARIVRAGEVVRIPAGIPHRAVVAGTRRLLAVAVHGAAEIVTSPVGAARRPDL